MDHDWPEIRQNTKLARELWGRLVKLLRREGTAPRVGVMFYKAVARAVLIFGFEI